MTACTSSMACCVRSSDGFLRIMFPWREQVCLDFTHEFLGPPHSLDCLPLAHAGNPVVSLVPNAQKLCQGPAQGRWVSLAPMDQLADEARLRKVMGPQVFWVSRGNLLIEQGCNGHLEASLIGSPRTIVQTAVSQLTLRPSQALLRLRQTVLDFIHTAVEFSQSERARQQPVKRYRTRSR